MRVFDAAALPSSANQINNLAMLSETSVFPSGITSNVVSTTLRRPQLTLTKTNSPTGTVKPGDIITYTLTLVNYGTGPATGVIISDSIPTYTTYLSNSASLNVSGSITGPNPLVFNVGTLAPGQTVQATFKVIANTLALGSYSITNYGQVTASNMVGSLNSNTVSNTLTVAPSFEVIKEVYEGDVPLESAKLGDVIPYKIMIYNTGNIPLTGITIADPMLGTLTGPTGDEDSGGQLDITEIWYYSGTYTVTQTDINNFGGGDDDIDNTVTVDFTETSPKTASATIPIEYVPVLIVSKTGPASAAVGSDVTYTVTLTLGGDLSPVTITSVSDTLLGSLANADAVKTGGDTDFILEAGETWTWTITRAVLASDPNSLVNTVTVNGTDRNGDQITSTDSHTIDVAFNPTLVVAKSGPLSASVGETVTYEVVLSLGPDYSPVNITSVSDSLLGTLNVADAVKTGGDGDGVLESGEIWTWEVTRTILPSDPSSLVNTVTVSGVDGDGQTVTGSDDHTISVLFNPVLNVAKTASSSSADVGSVVTYTVGLTLGGDFSPVTITSVVDDLIGSLSLTDGVGGLVKSGGDFDGVLESGETWTWTVVRVVLASDPDALINTVTVSGTTPGGTAVTGIDDYTLDVGFNPSLVVVKSGPLSAVVGSDVTYTVTLTLGADYSPVTITSVSDSLVGVLARADAVKTGGDSDFILEVGEVWTWTVTRTVLASDPVSLVNSVTVHGTDEDGDAVTGSGSCTLDVVYAPTLVLSKFGPATAHIGDTVTYEVVLSLGSDYSPVNITSALDSLIGALSLTDGVGGLIKTGGNSDNVLESGEVWTWTVTRTVLASDPVSLVNSVTVSGVDGDGDVIAQIASHTVDVIVNPVLMVVKSGPLSASVGESVTYTVTVQHDPSSDHSPVSNITVADSIAGAVTYKQGDDGDNVLEYGEIWEYTATYTILPTDPNFLINVVNVHGTNSTGGSISDSASHTLDVAFNPTLNVVKSSDPSTVNVGSDVTYTIVLTLGGDLSPVEITSVVDSLVGVLARADAVVTGVGSDSDYILEAGEVWTWTVTRTVLASDSNSLVNTVSVHGTDGDGDQITGVASCSVDVVFNPSLVVVKGGPSSAQVGDTVTYTVSLSLGADYSPVTITSVVDVELGVVVPLSLVDGVGGLIKTGGNSDNVLEVGEVWTWTSSGPVLAWFPDSFENTVIVDGTDVEGDLVSASATHTLNVDFAPTLVVVKSGPDSARVGEEVTYNVSLALGSDFSPVAITSVSDSLLGLLNLADAVKVGGDGDGVLEVGEVWTWTVTRTVLASDSAILINSVTVSGVDGDGDAVSGSAVCTVNVVFNPALVVVKSGPASAVVGSDVTYTVTLSLGADYSPVTITSVFDSLLGVLARADAVKTGGDSDFILEVGEVWTWTVSRAVLSSDPDSLVNTVTINGTDENGDVVTGSDSCTINIVFQSILVVVKSGPLSAHVGDTVYYTVTVMHGPASDASPVLLSHTTSVFDSTVVLTYVDGDTANLGYLDYNEIWTFTGSYTVTIGDSDPLENTVTVNGTDRYGDPIRASDSWSIDVLHPNIDVEKSGPVAVHEGDIITYTITIENTGDCALSSVTAFDIKLGWSWAGSLAVGEERTFTLSYTVPTPQTDNIINTASASGTDSLGRTVSDSDSLSVDVLHPSITVKKTGVLIDGTFTYTYIINNTGDCPLKIIEVTDSLNIIVSYAYGDTDHDSWLDQFETWIFTASYIQQTADDIGENAVTVSGQDNLNRTVTATAFWSLNTPAVGGWLLPMMIHESSTPLVALSAIIAIAILLCLSVKIARTKKHNPHRYHNVKG